MDRFERADELFEAALDLPKNRRGELLDRECAADPELRKLVEDLLSRADSPELDSTAGLTAWGTWLQETEVDLVGTCLGRYRVESELGRGGMGVVYQAQDDKLGRAVAIKLIDPAAGIDPVTRARFEREARAASAINHPNIVTIYDIAEHEQYPFIVMELVRGTNLRQIEKAPNDATLLDWARQLARALSSAHERGIVHRDLKPENVLVGEDGILRIVDFGLAQFKRASSRKQERSLTDPQLVRGTPGYLSPEAASGNAVDHRADQFALGVMLYELATRKRPFKGDTPVAVVASTLKDEPEPLENIRPDLSETLGEVIRRCLHKEPERRFASTRELLERLESEEQPAPRVSTEMARPRTRLIGRRRERELARQLIVEEGARLVTLSGPGGTGKTRLALQVADDLREHFRKRVFVVPLAAVADAHLVLHEVARALAIRGARGPLDAVQRELNSVDEPTLLVLDNLEQVIGSAAEIGELIAAVPSLQILVTSREVLRVHWEKNLVIAPLDLPPSNKPATLESIEQFAAVALFVERAQAVDPEFCLTRANASTIVGLCARLDGLPLAIELAAARIRTLSPHAMLERLQSSLRLLTSGARDVPVRQRTLRGTLDWSYELADEPEKKMFRRLGTFVVGFSFEAAETVVDPFGRSEVDPADLIESLLDKSLLQRSTAGGEPRFFMLQTIREYALDRLESDDIAEQTFKAHAAYFLVLAEEGAAYLARNDDRGLKMLAAEHENLRAALDWSIEQREVEWGMRLALGLFHYWERAEHLAEGRARLDRLLTLDAPDSCQPLRARVLHSAGVLASAQGDSLTAVELQESGLAVHRELGDDRGVAVSLTGIGIGATELRDYERAQRCLSESIQIWTDLGDDVGAARSLTNLAFVVKLNGRFAEAREMYEKAAALFEKAGDEIGAAWALNHQADVAMAQNQAKDANRLYQSALDRFRQLDHPWGVATCLADMGLLEADAGNLERARSLLRGSLKAFVNLGHKRGIARLLEALGRVEAGVDTGSGKLTDAAAAFAITLITAAHALRERIGTPLPGPEADQMGQCLERMRSTLTEEDWRQAEADGARMPLEQAIGRALGQVDREC